MIGVDRKPIELPLDVTEDDLEGMFGAGTYRLDLCDAEGEPLDVTTTISLGEPEIVTTNDPEEDEIEVSSVLPANVSDVRLVLEANVRATQLAFAHNERTLTASLRMADTLSDGIRDLANAQATWINTLASARGFFRNAQPLIKAAPVRDRDDNDNHDDNDARDGEDVEELEGDVGDAEGVGATNIYDVLKPFAEHAAPMLPMLAGGVFGTKPVVVSSATEPDSATDETRAEIEMAAKRFEARELIDLNYAAAKARAKKAAKARTAQPQATQPAVSLQARIAADPQLRARVMALKDLLLPAEIAEVFALASASTDREQQSLIDVLLQYRPEQAVRVIRHVLNERRGGPSMRITPIRVPASEAIPGTPPSSPDEASAHITNPKPSTKEAPHVQAQHQPPFDTRATRQRGAHHSRQREQHQDQLGGGDAHERQAEREARDRGDDRDAARSARSDDVQSGRIAVPTDGTEAAQGSTAGEYAPAAVHGAIAEKIGATSALLTDEQRGRITALVPMFACAALDNDPDVVAMVVRWMDLSPDNIAHEMVANLDALERRFEQ